MSTSNNNGKGFEIIFMAIICVMLYIIIQNNMKVYEAKCAENSGAVTLDHRLIVCKSSTGEKIKIE